MNKKNYCCKVVVNKEKVVNPYITYAPFEAIEVTLDKITYVVPKDWVAYESTDYENTVTYYAEENTEENGTSSVYLVINKIDFETPDYSVS